MKGRRLICRSNTPGCVVVYDPAQPAEQSAGRVSAAEPAGKVRLAQLLPFLGQFVMIDTDAGTVEAAQP